MQNDQLIYKFSPYRTVVQIIKINFPGMLEEIIPAINPPQGFKVLKAAPEITTMLPELESKISFLPFIQFLKDKSSEVCNTRSKFYNYLIERFEEDPALLEPLENLAILDKHADLLELLGTTLFPVVCDDEKTSYALAAPYQFSLFYYSDCFKKLFLDDRENQLLLPLDTPLEKLKDIQCSMIYDLVLEKFYGIRLNNKSDLIYPILDTTTGLKKFYRIRFDSRFIKISLKGTLPPLQDCAVCLNSFRILDLDKQLEKMPLDLFKLEGFAVWLAEDVTATESIDDIKKILLHHDASDTELIKELKRALYTLVALNNVEIGLMPLVKVNERFVLEEKFTRHSLVGQNWKANNPESEADFKTFLDVINEMNFPIPISNLDEEAFHVAPFLKSVYDKGARSFLYYPIQNNEGIFGILEIASPVPHLMSQQVMLRLEPAIPLLSVALLKIRNIFNNDIEKLIKEKFTALQQCVEWKFAEVAWDYLKSNGNGSKDNTANVIFDNVYPLYGAIDIRNSSRERSQALQKDLKEHLYLVENILEELQNFVQLPFLEGLKFKIQTILYSIKDVMTAEDELKINEFLENEIEPVFSHLLKCDPLAQEKVNNYLRNVKDPNSYLYHNRRDYEKSMAIINEAVLKFLETEEANGQKIYPHYFEKYRTDGLEYNIYIGQSIAPRHPFNLLYLKNIRMWQLKSMAEVAVITYKLLPDLEVPLQTTQLILVHAQCISINFRKDERKFDVEGSYNIRYEIMKKRLDKVNIKDTNERLTQPGTVAIVYSNNKEMLEYQEYIGFLQNKNILKPGISLLELEELQGIKGLKAIRVEVNLG
ncbi:hypothetical protein BH23BAC1_BH23BAC1_08880 [soil metagenome]